MAADRAERLADRRADRRPRRAPPACAFSRATTTTSFVRPSGGSCRTTSSARPTSAVSAPGRPGRAWPRRTSSSGSVRAMSPSTAMSSSRVDRGAADARFGVLARERAQRVGLVRTELVDRGRADARGRHASSGVTDGAFREYPSRRSTVRSGSRYMSRQRRSRRRPVDIRPAARDARPGYWIARTTGRRSARRHPRQSANRALRSVVQDAVPGRRAETRRRAGIAEGQAEPRQVNGD